MKKHIEGEWLGCDHCTTRFWGVRAFDTMGPKPKYCPQCINDSKQQKDVKRFIRFVGLNTLIDLSKVTMVKTDKQMFHLDQLPNGTWRLTYNESLIPDITQLQALEIIRHDEETVQDCNPR